MKFLKNFFSINRYKETSINRYKEIIEFSLKHSDKKPYNLNFDMYLSYYASIISSDLIKKNNPNETNFFWPYSPTQLQIFSSVLMTFRPEIIFEWGTNQGKSALIFSLISDLLKLKTEIHTIDLPKNIDHHENLRGNEEKKRGIFIKNKKNVIMHEGDGVTEAIKLKKNLKTLFFVDGDHSDEVVENEINLIVENFDDTEYLILIHDNRTAPERYYKINKNKFLFIKANLDVPAISILAKNENFVVSNY